MCPNTFLHYTCVPEPHTKGTDSPVVFLALGQLLSNFNFRTTASRWEAPWVPEVGELALLFMAVTTVPPKGLPLGRCSIAICREI